MRGWMLLFLLTAVFAGGLGYSGAGDVSTLVAKLISGTFSFLLVLSIIAWAFSRRML